jgi:hypothetical protein
MARSTSRKLAWFGSKVVAGRSAVEFKEHLCKPRGGVKVSGGELV